MRQSRFTEEQIIGVLKQADGENAEAGLAAAERQFDAAQAYLRQAEANDLKAQDDVNRYKPLAAKDEIPPIQSKIRPKQKPKRPGRSSSKLS